MRYKFYSHTIITFRKIQKTGANLIETNLKRVLPLLVSKSGNQNVLSFISNNISPNETT